ncbi:MAG: PD-(D/E)XK nuclease family transposase, partial [Clostridia bacterium]|nr:PD-(D/E)XK nuclease family transposase [Clostridia bacterium]
MDTTEQMEADQLQKLEAELAEEDIRIEELQKKREETIRQMKKARLETVVASENAKMLAANIGPMDNQFFIKVGEDPRAIEEIIVTVLGVPVRVVSAVPEYTILHIGSRGVRLDNYAEIRVEAELLADCEWGKKGALVDIEVQKEDKDDHEFRVFYNGASMIIQKTPKGAHFSQIPRAIVIFISSFDVFGDGKMYYEKGMFDVDSLKRRRHPVTEIFINTANLEKEEKSSVEKYRKISDLMRVFRDLDHYDEQFPAFSNRKKELHETEEGQREMSKEMQLVIAEVRRDDMAEGKSEGIAIGEAKGEIKGTVNSMRVD